MVFAVCLLGRLLYMSAEGWEFQHTSWDEVVGFFLPLLQSMHGFLNLKASR